ncbi:MAG: DUF4260 domain-containing protein [Rubrobacter sp.]|jgi:multisubunit Na+/H+ antiporter MnhB subunit|nr:DUF4260 domain-containing protein [Rubrobacter sp.]
MEGEIKSADPVYAENIAAGIGLRIGPKTDLRLLRLADAPNGRVPHNSPERDSNHSKGRTVESIFYLGATLRVEGGALFLASVALYGANGGGWLLFVVLLLAPDLSMLGYLAGVRTGAAVYNVFHAYPLPAALALYGVFTSGGVALSLALIWLAHIGVDRMVGYGLKYPTDFKDTHLNRV